MQTIKEFKIKQSWKFQMDQSKGLDGWNNYSGGMDKPDWVVVCSRSRDSDILDESNFQSALDKLGGENKSVAIERFNHWGCGWFELLLVNPKSSKHVKIAYGIHQSLENYPVLDDDDYYERENEYQSEYADGAKASLAEAISKHFGLKNTKALVALAFDLNMECQRYYGNDSCIDIYTGRTPCARDCERIKNCMEQLEHNYKNSKVFSALMSKLPKSV